MVSTVLKSQGVNWTFVQMLESEKISIEVPNNYLAVDEYGDCCLIAISDQLISRADDVKNQKTKKIREKGKKNTFQLTTLYGELPDLVTEPFDKDGQGMSGKHYRVIGNLCNYNCYSIISPPSDSVIPAA